MAPKASEPLPLRSDEQGQTDQSQSDSSEHRSARALPARPEPLEKDHPQRHHRNQQRRDSRRHVLLRPTHPAVPAEQEQGTADQAHAPLHPSRP